MGAGECSTLGRVLTPYENILAMTNESLKHSPQETRERLEEIASEKIRDIYKEFVSKYQSGLYRDALSELPYFERAPDGNYRKYYDDFMDRVIRGTSYARFEFEVIHQHEDSFQAGNRLAYLVDNCGEALFLEFSKKSSKRKKVIWSR